MHDDIIDMAIEDQMFDSEKFDLNSPKGIQQMVGAFKAFGMGSHLQRFMQAKLLKYIKEGKKYKIAGYKTFDEFCKNVGISRRRAYELIKHLNQFGISAYEGLVKIGMKETDLRLLKSLPMKSGKKNGVKVIEIAGESLTISSENKDDIVEIIHKLANDKKADSAREKAEERAEQREKEVLELSEKVRKYESPIDDSRMTFQKELSEIQLKMMEIDGQLLSLYNRAKNDNNKHGDLFATLGWIGRFAQDIFAKYTQEEPESDEDFYGTSFLNKENRIREE